MCMGTVEGEMFRHNSVHNTVGGSGVGMSFRIVYLGQNGQIYIDQSLGMRLSGHGMTLDEAILCR